LRARRYFLKTYDRILDLHFAQYRFYSAGDKRFTAEEPVKDGANWYAYCNNNPVGFVDPLGLIKATVTINGVKLNVDTAQKDSVMRMLEVFDSSVRTGKNSNELYVYNYQTKAPATVKYGKDVTIGSILDGAGFTRNSSGPSGYRYASGPAGYYYKISEYIVEAESKYTHHMGVSDSDFQKMPDNLTERETYALVNSLYGNSLNVAEPEEVIMWRMIVTTLS